MAVRLISASCTRIHEKTIGFDSWAQKVWFLLSRHDVRRVHEKIFLLADSSELMAVRLISASCAQTPLIPTMMYIEFKTFDFVLLSLKTFDTFFLDMMYVEFMKNFLLADSSELMAVRLISASWAQKRLIPTF